MKVSWFLVSSLSLVLISCDPKQTDSKADTPSAPEGPKEYLLVDESFEPAIGRVIHDVTSNQEGKGSVMMTADGNKIAGSFVNRREHEFRITTLSKNTMRIEEMKCTGVFHVTMDNDPVSDSFKPCANMGIPVILTKENGRWSGAREDGKEATKDERDIMDSMAKAYTYYPELRMYGTVPRKVGDTWETSGEEVGFFGETMHTSGLVKTTLTKVEEYEGQLCAFISVSMDLTGVPKEQEAQKMNLNYKAEIETIRSLDQQLDLKVDCIGKMITSYKQEKDETIYAGPLVRKVRVKIQ